MKEIAALGIDIGASSGRGFVGYFDGARIRMEELHRFESRPVAVFSGYYWDILNVFGGVKRCIQKANTCGIELISVGVDTCAQDYGLLDSGGKLIGNPHHYRDTRTNGLPEKYGRVFTKRELFDMTGMLPYNINTLYQLLATMENEKSSLEIAHSMLFIADLLTYFMTGEKFANSTLASMSLLFNQFEKKWDTRVINAFGIPQILPDIVGTGTLVGRLTGEMQSETGTGGLPVISVIAHDTASAAAAVPAKLDQTVFISCGTWSTAGTEVPQPVTCGRAFEFGFCNELGQDNRVLLVKNITGLWVLQECIREWERGGYLVDYDYLDQYTLNSRFDSVIDLDWPPLGAAGNMCGKIVEYLRESNQPIPESKEDIYRCVVLSLAVKYRQTVEQLEILTEKKFGSINIVGGGSKNKALCEITAQLTGKCVTAGPAEASAIGNILVQLDAMNEINAASDAIAIINRSVPLTVYSAKKSQRLNAIYENFLRLSYPH